MPVIRVDGPPIPEIERKRELVKRLTEVAVDIYNIEHISRVNKRKCARECRSKLTADTR